MARKIIASATLLILIAACSPESPEPGADGLGDPYFPLLGNSGYDAQHYTLDLFVDVERNRIAGTARVDARATQALSAFNLDLSGLEVHDIKVDGLSAGHSRAEGELTVSLPQPLRTGTEFTVVVSYGGTPEPLQSTALTFPTGWTHYQDGILVLWAPGSAATWFPNNDHPSDKALYTLRIKVPRPLQVVANGLLLETIDDGDSVTYVWVVSDPVQSDGVILSIAEYTVESTVGPGGLPISTHVPIDMARRRAQNTATAFEQLPEMIQFLSDVFGPFPFESLDLTWSDRLPAAGYLAPSRIVLHPGEASSPALMVHELAHQWFGNSVAPEDQQYWLAEGFATYAEFLWEEHVEGAIESPVRWCHILVGSTTPSLVNPPVEELLDAFVYDRGALTLHALRVRVGDRDFFRIVQTLADRYAHSSATTADFVSLAEDVTGDDLRSFFDDWLFEEEVPPIEALGLVGD